MKPGPSLLQVKGKNKRATVTTDENDLAYDPLEEEEGEFEGLSMDVDGDDGDDGDDGGDGDEGGEGGDGDDPTDPTFVPNQPEVADDDERDSIPVNYPGGDMVITIDGEQLLLLDWFNRNDTMRNSVVSLTDTVKTPRLY